MILAEIADKMPSPMFYFGADLLSGVCVAATLVFIQGIPRLIVFVILASLTAFFAWGLQVDSDLVAADRTELGQSYLMISKYWFLGAIAVALFFSLVFQSVFGTNKPSQKVQAEQVGAGQPAIRSESKSEGGGKNQR